MEDRRKEERRKGSRRTAELTISGLDTNRGIALTGGTLAGYSKVLAIFSRDSAERLSFFEAYLARDDQRISPAFVTCAHALKGALASIGAVELSAQAARLEAAGRAEDQALVQKDLPCFIERLARLGQDIRAALNDPGLERGHNETAPGTAAPPDGDNAASNSSTILPFLGELENALLSGRAGEIDRILAELGRLRLSPALQEALDTVSGEVLVAEYGKACDIVRQLIA